MIEVRNLRLPLAGGRAQGEPYDEGLLARAAAKRLGVRPADVSRCSVARRSVDARHKDDVRFVLTARVELAGGAAAEREALARAGSRDAAPADVPALPIPQLPLPVQDDRDRPVVVGAGSAGLFCALVLALGGARPVLVERGDDPARRAEAIRSLEDAGTLDQHSNVQFGCGGAGMFSDGKLTTGTKSPAIPWVLGALADHGAPSDILWEARPHVGSDMLPGAVGRILDHIESLGGTVLLRAHATELLDQNGLLSGVRLVPTTPAGGAPAGPRCLGAPLDVAASRVVMACGHSARDTFSMLLGRGVAMERKTFAMGARIEHPQSMVDRAQYGRFASDPALPPADYKLSCHLADGRGVYTFCMCPGGYVVAAASEPGGVVTNGMSEFRRDGENANSALLVNVLPSDLPGDDVLAGVDLQRACEKAAFQLGGGGYVAPAQLVGDFLHGRPSSQGGGVRPTYPRGVAWGSVEGALPAGAADAMRQGIAQMARRLRGFDRPDAVLTAPESRSSSPVRMVRDPERREAIRTPGLFPCGEGAGYAGGIMSAATDGVATALAILRQMGAAPAAQ